MSQDAALQVGVELVSVKGIAQAVALAGFPAPAQLTTIDGLRVDWPDGFGLMRASNTTPVLVLVLRFESRTPEALERIPGAMLALLRRVKPDAVLGGGVRIEGRAGLFLMKFNRCVVEFQPLTG